jgi:hypothetical protein
MNPRLLAGGVLSSLWLLGLPTWAVEYRLQVVNLDALTVLAHIDNSEPAPHGEARQSRLEARLDNGGFSGDSVAFVVRSEMRAWQEVEAVAANAEGVLRRLVIGSGRWFGRSRPEVCEVAYDHLANAVAQGTFRH